MVFVFAYATHIVADYARLLVRPNPTLPPDLLWPFMAPLARPLEPRWAGPGSINVWLWSAFAVVVLSVGPYLLLEVVRAEGPDQWLLQWGAD